MSETGQTEKSGGSPPTSFVPLKADIPAAARQVRFVPIGHMSTGLLTHGRTAIAEISTFKSRGKRATSTVARAGGVSLK